MTADELLAVPPAEFVRARNALVKELREAGKREEAKEIAALRRPSPSLWAVNQLARRHEPELDALLDAGKKLRAAQRSLLSGGERDALRAAESELRRAVAALVGRAEEILGGATAAASRRTSDTLRGAALGDEPTRKALRAGRLETELQPTTGFDVTAAPGKLPPRVKVAKAAKPDAREAKRRAAEEAREAKRRAKLGARLERLRAEAREAERRAAQARARVSDAEAAL